MSRNNLSSSTDAASSVSGGSASEERGAFPLLMLPQKIRHRRISSGSRSFFASSSAPPSAPPARAVSEGFRNEPVAREAPANAVDLPPKLPRKASFGSRNEKTHHPQTSGTSVGSASFNGSAGFVSTPTGASVASASLASFNSEESKKGKRKRRELAKDERWAGVRRVIEGQSGVVVFSC